MTERFSQVTSSTAHLYICDRSSDETARGICLNLPFIRLNNIHSGGRKMR